MLKIDDKLLKSLAQLQHETAKKHDPEERDDDFCFQEDNFLYSLIEKYSKESKILRCKEAGRPFPIKHDPPGTSEPDICGKVFFVNFNDSKVILKMEKSGGKECPDTLLTYLNHHDVFVGEREVTLSSGEKKIFQIMVEMITVGEYGILEISYHNLEDPLSQSASHDGTIHPVE